MERSDTERGYLLRDALRKELQDPTHREDLKLIIKAAHEEWLNEKWAQFGKWTAAGVAATLVSALVSFYLWARMKGFF